MSTRRWLVAALLLALLAAGAVAWVLRSPPRAQATTAAAPSTLVPASTVPPALQRPPTPASRPDPKGPELSTATTTPRPAAPSPRPLPTPPTLVVTPPSTSSPMAAMPAVQVPARVPDPALRPPDSPGASNRVATTPPAITSTNSETGPLWLRAQVALISRGISPGSIDGVGGTQSAEALKAFQVDHHLEANGRLDAETLAQLDPPKAALGEFVVTAQDLARLRPVPTTWLGKSEAAALDFENLAELVGERTQCHPGFLRRLNPGVDWDHPTPGLRLKVPVVRFPTPRRASLVRISLAGKWLRAFDDAGGLLAHFPCSIAARVEKRPVGDLHVAVTVKGPNYTFDPQVFPESAEARTLGRKIILPSGPNNPVGVAWIGLDRPGYGIHGTPSPEQVGRTESHGCFRLANWNAEYLRQMCWTGLRVSVER